MQVLAYMYRFDAKTGYYFFLNQTGKSNEVLFLNQGITYEKMQMREDIKLLKLDSQSLKKP